MKKLFLLILLLLSGYLVLTGQTAEDETIRLKQTMGAVESGPDAELQLKQVDEKTLKGSWDVSVGTGFTYMKGYGSGMQVYAAPVYTLPLTDRWSLHGGLLALHYTGLNTPGLLESAYPTSGASLAVFGAASYRMSERLVLHGAGVKHLVSGPTSPLSHYTMDHLTVGATYKLGDNISIGASVRMIQGHGYYQGSPFQSPFGW